MGCKEKRASGESNNWPTHQKLADGRTFRLTTLCDCVYAHERKDWAEAASLWFAADPVVPANVSAFMLRTDCTDHDQVIILESWIDDAYRRFDPYSTFSDLGHYALFELIADMQRLLAVDLTLTTRARSQPFERVWPDCETFIGMCVAAAPALKASDRRTIRGFLLYWATYRKRNTGLFDSPPAI